ncbi:MAG: type II toxin-antitoxin system RelE/ParE family toxin [Alphaproteobacteria bacterium]|nr:type II toxin-antitoxin system RelE/ParE family toxin [Alphaproteobacteria bacterium]
MTPVIVSPNAEVDFFDILDRLTELAGAAVAERYAADLHSIYERLSTFPEIGAPRPAVGSRTRIVALSPYLVIYEYLRSDGFVHIIRILDGRRNVTRRLVRE